MGYVTPRCGCINKLCIVLNCEAYYVFAYMYTTVARYFNMMVTVPSSINPASGSGTIEPTRDYFIS